MVAQRDPTTGNKRFFGDISNDFIVNCTFQFSKVHALLLFNIIIRSNGVKLLSDANFDTIVCANTHADWLFTL